MGRRRRPKIQVLRGEARKWYWRILACNGKVLSSSKLYCNKTQARKTAFKVHTYATTDVDFEVIY